ncbi:uncharacterized protein TRIADDRAFT_30594 [Trichoplax adhaerens]|uniref:Lysosomal dipeptide transporter MFSD1 n=1 Tax=Trichoplax adhaerens TaxID=10228 RepID=B3S7J7_TRIAD|nr:hypothetical protein TRIADDRAFT_30594 [Trichoplax adhaerens]EDV21302.1 hypothetical protein TRIADDRAFT_30594 [Trichoplax adhaerens]|eukprot:XP_002116269.1 hypothetical protein TRIADDRAFT_30594 [Trichoplax adhaerens]
MACDPRRALHRYLVLILMCFLSFGSYFVYDNPAALEKQIETDMRVNAANYELLYSLYSWPNVVLCFFGGYLLDTFLGLRFGTIVFALFVLVGQIIFAIGAQLDKYWLMCVGRFVFGIGGESLAVGQNTYAVSWFKGKELNMVFGLQLSFSRVGSTVNINIMGPIYRWLNNYLSGYQCLGATLWFGCAFCILSLFCAVLLAYYDKRANRLLGKDDEKTGEKVSLLDVKDFSLQIWLMFIICVAYYVTVFPFISLGLVFFEERFGLDPAAASAVNSIVYLLSAFMSPIFGILVDKVGRNLYWVILGVVATLGSHMLMAFTFLNPYIAMVTMGLAYSLLACALWPMVAYVIPEHQLGTAYGIMQAIQNLGLAVVAIVAGDIVDSKGYLFLEVFFGGCLSIALIAAVALYLVDAARGGTLNYSAKKRNMLAEAENL